MNKSMLMRVIAAATTPATRMNAAYLLDRSTVKTLRNARQSKTVVKKLARRKKMLKKAGMRLAKNKTVFVGNDMYLRAQTLAKETPEQLRSRQRLLQTKRYTHMLSR